MAQPLTAADASPVALLLALAATLLLLAAPAESEAAQPGAKPKVAIAKEAKVGKLVKVRGSGFPAGFKVWITLQPTAYRGGNGAGRRVWTKRKISPTGRFSLKFRFPRSYSSCAGYMHCSKYAWKKRSRVDVNVCAEKDGTVPACVRRVVKLS